MAFPAQPPLSKATVTSESSNATGSNNQAFSSGQPSMSNNADSPTSNQQDQPGLPLEHDAKQNETARLAQLSATVRDQNDLEKDVGRQADQMLLEQADERDQKRLDKALKERE